MTDFVDEETGKKVELQGIPADAVKKSLRGDPFAVREGKTLTWRNINMTLVRVVH